MLAYNTLQNGLPKSARDHDARVGSVHNRRNRGFVKVSYGDCEITFYPIKSWSATVGVSLVTLRNWMHHSIISAYEMHDMPVMCLAELHALKTVVSKWHASRDIHHAIEPEFKHDLRKALADVRLALDTFKRHLPMTPTMYRDIETSLPRTKD